MDESAYTTVRTNLVSAMDRDCNNHKVLISTRNGELSVVI